MCGFVGIIDLDRRGRINEAELSKMTSTLYHRGPDEGNIKINDNVGLGFRRLSIIDLVNGSQPMSISRRTTKRTVNSTKSPNRWTW